MSNHDPSPHEIQLVIGETVLAPPPDVTLAKRSRGLPLAQSTSPTPMPTRPVASRPRGSKPCSFIWGGGSMGLYTINNTNIGTVP